MRARAFFTVLFSLSAATLLMGCAAQGRAEAPDDLLITYEWREGSLPPPYHYEYSVRVQADGKGEVTMVPDYPGDGVPVWTEPFTLTPAQLDQLYAALVDKGLLSERWAEDQNPPVGGSSEHMSVVAAGRTIEIPAFVVPAQQSRAATLYLALRSFVPAPIFEGLEAKRAAYEREHERP